MLDGYHDILPIGDDEHDEIRILESYAALHAAVRVPARRDEWLAYAFTRFQDSSAL